jgi:hypothetical protein
MKQYEFGLFVFMLCGVSWLRVDPARLSIAPTPLMSLTNAISESLHNLLASHGYPAETYSSGELFLASDGLAQSNCIIADVEMTRRQMVSNSSTISEALTT